MLRHLKTDTAHTAYLDEGEGETVVLLHGGFSDARDFLGNLARLADRYRVLSPDRRGLGRTPDIPGPISLDALVNDVVAFITAVATPPGVPDRLQPRGDDRPGGRGVPPRSSQTPGVHQRRDRPRRIPDPAHHWWHNAPGDRGRLR